MAAGAQVRPFLGRWGGRSLSGVGWSAGVRWWVVRVTAGRAGGVRSWLRARAPLVVVSLVVALSGVGVLRFTDAAFTATTTNPGNTVGAGTVVLADDDSGTALFTLGHAKPGDSATGCVTVTYTG